MNYLTITGGVPLCGKIDIQGSKNAVLPILAACLPGNGTCTVENCPKIRDVEDSLDILQRLGCRVGWKGNAVQINAENVGEFSIIGSKASRIRSSVLFLGALLGKMGRASLPLPGGCAIGSRPVDLHIEALSQLGAVFTVNQVIEARADTLYGCTVRLSLPSVGATENLILAAVQAKGETVIENAAREPEVDELCSFLNLRGARIRRKRDGSIRIEGVRELGGAVYRMGADRIVAGTYMMAAAAAGGKIVIRNFPHRELKAVTSVLEQAGVLFKRKNRAMEIQSEGRLQAVPYTETAPYPGFPTDLQSPLMAVLCRAKGESRICETLFERRFQTAEELLRMGACIETEGCCARICGVDAIYPAHLTAPDLRGGAALVIAALQADGSSVIAGTQYIERGYEDICRDLQLLGADIRRGNSLPAKRQTDNTEQTEKGQKVQIENEEEKTHKTKDDPAAVSGSSCCSASYSRISFSGQEYQNIRK